MGNNLNNQMNNLNLNENNNLSNNQNIPMECNSNNIRNQNQNINENLRKEHEIEENIRDFIKCNFCLTREKKQKMCKYCKRISCEKCFNKWMEKHNYCGFCQKMMTKEDLVSLPFLDDMCVYFINNNPKNIQINNIKSSQKNIQNNKQKIVNNENICPIHNNEICYYCIQCDKYFCSNCLTFFSEETKKHENHLIIQTSQMNNLNLQEAIKEYKKLRNKKIIIDNYIDLCKVKLKENQAKKTEIADSMNLILDLYLQKIEENSKELQSFLNDLTIQRDQIENNLASIPNKFIDIIINDNVAQINKVSEDLKKINKIDKNIENGIKEKTKVNPNLFLYMYETDYLEFSLPFSGQYKEGHQVFNKKLNIIPGFPSNILFQYLDNQINISFSVDIDLPKNDPRYPKFYSYVVFRNGKDGLEFMNLSNQDFPNQENNPGQIRQQVNKISFKATKFIRLGGDDKRIKMKLFIIKCHYE